MSYLNDTNILLRWAQPNHPLNGVVQAALDILQAQGEAIYITPQNLIEFWNSATRPVERNGFGMTPAEAEREMTRLEEYFRLAPDTAAIYPAWRELVVVVGVSGVPVHDARLAAVMRVHGLTHILTLNTQDFRRYPGIVAVHPQEAAEQLWSESVAQMRRHPNNVARGSWEAHVEMAKEIRPAESV